MNKLFRRFPYIGWLLVAGLLWCTVIYRSAENQELLKPAAMSLRVSEDLQSRQEALDEWLRNKEFFQKIFEGKLSAEEAAELSDVPFQLYAFEGNVLVFWNNNTVIGTCLADSSKKGYNELFRSNGTYLKKCIRLPFLKQNQYLVVLFPIVYNYPFENDYLHSHFAAVDYIPVSTKVVETRQPGAYTVRDAKARPLFYLQFKASDIAQWIQDPVLLVGLAVAFIFSLIWVNLIAAAIAKRKKPIYGLLIVLGVIALIRSLTYWLGYPFHLGDLPLFSPQLYASSKVLASLGDLILNILCTLWLIVFIFSYFKRLRFLYPTDSKMRNGFLAALLAALLTSCAFFPADMIRSLVIDSGISFDVSHFYSINVYTVVGLFTIALIACCVAFIIYLLNIQFRSIVRKHWLRYLLLLAAAAIFFLLKWKAAEVYEYYAFGWLFLFVVLLDIPILRKASGLFAPSMIFWATFIAAFATFALKYFNSARKRDNRRLFVERLVNQRDNVMEYLFEDIGVKISNDPLLRGYLDSPNIDTRPVIDEHLATTYLRGQLNRYDSRIYLFNSVGTPLYNSDTTKIPEIVELEKQAQPVNRFLFYREDARDAHYYLASVPVKNDSGGLLGYVFIDMTLKKAANESVYPELLQPGKFKNEILKSSYSYGIYVNKRLITQTNDYPFPVYLQTDSLKVGDFKAVRTNEYVQVWYKMDNGKVVVILHRHSKVLENITLFSYLLGVLVVFALVALVLRLFFRYILLDIELKRVLQLTLRKRIHLAMLGVVLVSFLIIGAVTIWFFINNYNDTNKEKLQSSMQILERSVQQYLKDQNISPDEFSFDIETDQPKFKAFINSLANSQGIDINVYNSYGTLKATSQEDIYNKSILARIMTPEAYYRLYLEGRTLWVQNEQIGKLKYLSCYVPLRDESGETLGYINVPFFASQKELSYQISNVLVALINLYAFVFLLSSLLAVLITNWLTRTLHVIISKFERFNLQKNELLEWKHDDEIGMLIKEYNKMVMKVEENATLLAQSERESAWREMARQVAHEIKNPLTPMKLNIQYLQQALKNNHPNARQLTENVAESLIEQIDNLSHIASAFSDFAKMPEALPEEVDLNELLFNATELYLNNTSLHVNFEHAAKELIVYADRSQLLRVVTNLLQNAVEAIPEDREGIITVSLTEEHDQAKITVADNGNGIPEDVQDKIFEPYFTTKGSGTGLGLAMTKRIIEFWKGKITFKTRANEGTKFFIELPIVKSEEDLSS
ncbi:MAG TPA: ATP-binding protein [Flavipsychrobacter sp.]|nr:ATP-binding protein [Flavipsychrobacter sp.]